MAEGTQGPRTYMFSAQRIRVNAEAKARGDGLGSLSPEPGRERARYYLSNAPEDTPLDALAYVGGSRWRIETEFETGKSDVGPD